MPANVTPQFKKAHAEYLAVRTVEEKIEKLKLMIRLAPKHKGSENLLANLKSRLAKLKKELQKQKKVKKHKKVGIKKEGDAQISLLGYTNSGKSLLLSRLTNAKPNVSKFPYTTTKPEQGMLDVGALVQVLDLPSLKDSEENEILGYANNSDLVLIVGCSIDEIKKAIEKIKNKNVLVVINKADIIDTEKIKKEFSGAIEISALQNKGIENLKNRIFDSLNIIRIFTKQPGHMPKKRPVILKENSTVEDFAGKIHKDFIKRFKFAKVWRKKSFQRVGLKYILKDSDIVEIHT